MKSNTPQYGIDAPGIIRGFLVVGSALSVVGALVTKFRLARSPIAFVGPLFALAGVVSLGFGTAMTAYGLRGKFRMRDRILSSLSWRGDEQVLDIGTGRGLLAIGAAKHLTGGQVIGIDIWRAEDLSGNTLTNARANAQLEGVEEKIDFQDGDASQMPFFDDAFDVIVSLLCLHNIEDEQKRINACTEIARVLKPGGTALIADYIPTAGYARALAKAGLKIRSSRSYWRDAYGLMWMVIAVKSG